MTPPSDLDAIAEMKWQPIETCPDDGNRKLLIDNSGPYTASVGMWDVIEGCWRIFDAKWTPTHWMPLPAPPVRTGKAEGEMRLIGVIETPCGKPIEVVQEADGRVYKSGNCVVWDTRLTHRTELLAVMLNEDKLRYEEK